MRKFLSIIFLVTVCGIYAFSQTSGTCGENLTWTLDEDGTLTISGTGAMEDYTLASRPWDEKIKKLVLEEGVTYIGNFAFYNCSEITGSLILPASLTSIGEVAFAFCSGFSGELTLPEGLTSIDGSFAGCSGFTGTLTLPVSLTSIGESSFRYCSGFTGNLTLPEGLTSIGANSFESCSGFTGTLTLPASLTSIDDYAFYDCRGFTGSLTLPESLTSIGNYAFLGSGGFTGSLTLPEGLTGIGLSAFFGCSGLADTLTLPESLINIGDDAFGSTMFTIVWNENKIPIAIAVDVFSDQTLSGAKLYVPAGSKTAYSQAEVWKSFSIEEYGVGIHPSFDETQEIVACGTEITISDKEEAEIYYGLGKDAAPTLKYTTPIVVNDTTYISAYSKVRNVYSDTVYAKYIPEHASSFVGMDWDWSAEHKATLSLTCPRCKTGVKPAVSLTEELTKEPTEEGTGLKTYTATATANEVEYKSTNREVLAKLTKPIHDTVTKTDTVIITEVKTDTIIITDTVYIEVPVGNTETKAMKVKLYPNPTNGSFTVEAEEDAQLQIYDAAGACIRSGRTQGGRFTGSLPSSGLYFIKLTSGNRTYTRRLIVK